MKPIRGNNGNNNRVMNNFFTKMIQRHGEDFLEKANSGELSNGAIQLFRDLSKGRVDIQKHGHYFLNQRLLDVCITEANIKAKYYNTHVQALTFFITNCGEQFQPDFYQQCARSLESDNKALQAYNLIVYYLNGIYATGDPNILPGMISALRNFRSNI